MMCQTPDLVRALICQVHKIRPEASAVILFVKKPVAGRADLNQRSSENAAPNTSVKILPWYDASEVASGVSQERPDPRENNP